MFGFFSRANTGSELSRLSTMLQRRRSHPGCVELESEQSGSSGETIDAASLDVTRFFAEARLKIAAGCLERAPKR